MKDEAKRAMKSFICETPAFRTVSSARYRKKEISSRKRDKNDIAKKRMRIFTGFTAESEVRPSIRYAGLIRPDTRMIKAPARVIIQ